MAVRYRPHVAIDPQGRLITELVGVPVTIVAAGGNNPLPISEDQAGTIPIVGSQLTVTSQNIIPGFWVQDNTAEADAISGPYRVSIDSLTGVKELALDSAASAQAAADNIPVEVEGQLTDPTSAAYASLTDAATTVLSQDPTVVNAATAAVDDAIAAEGGVVDPTIATLVGDPGSQTRAALAGTYGSLPDAYIDPRDFPDGPVTGLSHGTFSASYGNSPAVIVDGQIQHTPTGPVNTAAYIEAELSGPARRIGAVIEWGAGATGVVALVIPATSWAGAIGNAGVHATINAAGTVSCRRYLSGSVQGGTSVQVGALTGRHVIEVGVDTSRQEITVWLDDVAILRYIDATAFTYLSEYAIWELYESTGASVTPAIIRSAWADIERLVPTTIPLSTQPARQAYGIGVEPSFTEYPIGTQAAAIGLDSVTAIAPPSGKLLARYSCWVDASLATGNVMVAISSQGAQRYAPPGYVGRVVAEVLLSGFTPGSNVTIIPMMWVLSGSATVVVGGSSGAYTVSAIEVA